jgi:hypothetical protein
MAGIGHVLILNIVLVPQALQMLMLHDVLRLVLVFVLVVGEESILPMLAGTQSLERWERVQVLVKVWSGVWGWRCDLLQG